MSIAVLDVLFYGERRVPRFTIALFLLLSCVAVLVGQDLTPPSAPTGLTATAATCGQVDLSWGASVDNAGGSGLKAYTINRSDGISTTIGSARTTFSDTNYERSSTALTYNVVAMDNAGNKSPSSNTAYVSTPACALATGEAVIDGAYFEPFGKTMATYGARTAVIYVKQNQVNLTWDTWLNVNDSDTNQTSHFLLHGSPGYYQIETDYVLTSATDLWTLSWDSNNSGKLMVTQYKLSGSPPTSAAVVSTKSLGDSNSYAKSMIRLQSGGLMVAWCEQSWNYTTAIDLTTGFAYRSPTGTWSVKFPVTVPNATAGNDTRTQMILAQHPADGSIWAFEKRDGFYELGALHFTELAASNDFTIDWINPTYINHTADGNNSPEVEFPYLAASPDPTRNAILLAYQTYPYQMVYIDPLFPNSNSIYLKEAPATIAQIRADASKTFIGFPTYMERAAQFGMSVLSDGTIWLVYTPINHQTLTRNEVYSSKYFNNAWSAPAFAGFDYGNYNELGAMRDPGVLIYRTDQAGAAFMTPDQKVHTITLSNSSPPPPDTTPPTTSITNPVSGATLSGVVSISASAADNVGVTRVDLLIDGAVKGTATASPYTFSWDTSTVSGNHSLQTVAYDAAGNSSVSATITVSVSTAGPTTSITAPSSGATVSGTVSVSATASSSVVKMNLMVDGVLNGTKTGAPYLFSWDTTKAGNGNHTLQTVAYDAVGNTGVSAAVSDTVANGTTTPPAVSISNPANGASVPHNTTVTVTAIATDSVGITKVEFYINNTLVSTDTAAPYTYAWKVPGKRSVSYTIKVIAYDAAGNTASGTSTVTSQ